MNGMTLRDVARRRYARLFLAVACLAAVVLPRVALAADTDTVVLANGDRLRGEVKNLERGRLEFKTSAMSTIYIEWDKISELTAGGEFEIETADGSRLLGRPVAASPGRFGLALSEGRTVVLDILSVVRMRQIKQGFLQRLSGSINLGGSYTRSSQIGQVSLTSNIGFRRPSFQMSANFDNTFSLKDDVVSNRTSFRAGYTRLLARRWFIPGLLRTERNPDLGYNLRASVGGGVGRFLVQSNSGSFALAGGAVFGREIPVSGDGFNNLEGFLGAQTSFYRYDSPKADLGMSVFAYPSFTDAGRFRLELDSAVSYEIIKDFTIGVTVYDSFDNRPPTEGASKNDVGITFTIGWKFG